MRTWLAQFGGFWVPGLDPTRIRLLGLLDLVIGDFDEAVAELEQARTEYTAQRPGPNYAWINSELVEALIARASRGDGERAAELLKEGLPMARNLGLVPLQKRYRRLKAKAFAATCASRSTR